MSRYIENWRVTNPPGLTNRQIGGWQKQSGMSSLAYRLEHPKAYRLVFKRDGSLNRNFNRVVVSWRGRTNPYTGLVNGKERQV